MAKQNGNGNGNGNGVKALSKEEKIKLFEAYEKYQLAVDTAEQAVEAAKVKRGLAVKAIIDALGQGPFQWRDEILTPTVRQSKDDDGKPIGEPTYFFRGKRKEQTIERIG